MKVVFLIIAAFAAFVIQPVKALEYSEGYSGGNCSTCSWIAADGVIAEGDAARLLEYLRSNEIDYHIPIVINSPGGDLAAALELGDLIRERGFDVIVGLTTTFEHEAAGRSFQEYSGGVCASACVFVLMGGAVREIADEDSRVGVHQFAPAADELGSVASATSSTQSVVALLQSYAASMGVNPAVLALASSTRPEDMTWLDPRDMESLNLLTSRNYRNMGTWALQPAGSQLLATTSQEQENGRRTAIIADCRELHIGFEVVSERIADIASSIVGAQLGIEGSRWSYPLTITDIVVQEGMILVSFVGGPAVLSAIEQANNLLIVDVELPRAYADEFGGWTFDLPTSNIAEVAPHVLNSCR